jgi:hypothetical protein
MTREYTNISRLYMKISVEESFFTMQTEAYKIGKGACIRKRGVFKKKKAFFIC